MRPLRSPSRRDLLPPLELIKPGSIVVFSLSRESLLYQLGNDKAIKAIEDYTLQKYLGVIVDTHSGEYYDALAYVDICPIATCPPSQEVLDDLHCRGDAGLEGLRSRVVQIEDSLSRPRLPPEARPIVRPSPRLPWAGCNIYTQLLVRSHVDEYCPAAWRKHTRVNEKERYKLWRTVIRDRNAREEYEIMLPRPPRIPSLPDKPDKRMEFFRKWGAGSRSTPRGTAAIEYLRDLEEMTDDEIGSGDEVEWYAAGLQNGLVLWEDLSMIKELPSPGGFDREWKEIQDLVVKCYVEHPNEIAAVREWVEETAKSPMIPVGREGTPDWNMEDDGLPLGWEAPCWAKAYRS